MAFVLSDNVISPLGVTSSENYLSVKAGKSGIRSYAAGSCGIPEGFTASLLPDDMMERLRREGNAKLHNTDLLVSRFGLLAFSSAHEALASSGADVERERTVFILSTTKGPIEETEAGVMSGQSLADVARQIALSLGIRSKAIVVCNACVSGLSAIILANRLLEKGTYDVAVVCGVDCPGKFILSGFQSLKALSSAPCRPFDMERFGLNLGEAAATLVLARKERGKGGVPMKRWELRNGYVKNDAFHITSPDKDAVGLCHALRETLHGVEIRDLSFVNAHGTATLFNDQMESVAIERAGLSMVPTNALKGYFGHTLGAAGILETIMSIHGADDATILGTKGFEEPGVSGKMNLSGENRKSDKTSFVKMLSGFGGCNATLLAQRDESFALKTERAEKSAPRLWTKRHSIRITPQSARVDGREVYENKGEGDFVTQLYKLHIGSYPKYYKMDALSRLGFVASELLLEAEKKERFTKRGDRAVVLCNRSSSICSDKKYWQSIREEENYFPSPSVFVYTLPNIVTGEIAIRNGYQGETSFYVLCDKDEEQIDLLTDTAFSDRETSSVLGGWLDYEDATRYEADLFIADLSFEP